MSRSANVSSIEAIRNLRVALNKFESGARDAVTLLELEVRRGVDWIEQDRRRYWPDQVKQASEQLVQARNDLERCQLRVGSDDPPSCYEQKKRYEKAKRRLRYCEEQVRAVKRWIRTIHQELAEFHGQLAQMTSCLDADVPQAVTTLARMLDALEKYAESRHLTEVSASAEQSKAMGKPQA